MTIERELLELAAKACGVDAQWDCPERGMMMLTPDGIDTMTWNPLTDDGDCARMEAQLGIWVAWREEGVIAACVKSSANNSELFSDHAGDKNAARRAASVAVAAEIGRMK